MFLFFCFFPATQHSPISSATSTHTSFWAIFYSLELWAQTAGAEEDKRSAPTHVKARRRRYRKVHQWLHPNTGEAKKEKWSKRRRARKARKDSAGGLVWKGRVRRDGWQKEASAQQQRSQNKSRTCGQKKEKKKNNPPKERHHIPPRCTRYKACVFFTACQ